ncbi:MAG: hypothetical protein FJ343_04500 [Sphingomonadales bacterium]|nr:hypothetical protein [Sphingomonadales bacterium]
MSNIPLATRFQSHLKPISSHIWFIILLNLGLGEGLSQAQPLSLGWQGLPSTYSEAKQWDIIGQAEKGLWILLNRKQEQRLEYRNLRMQLQQTITLPSYLNQSDKIALLNTDSGMHLLFDLFNPSAGEHGLFVSRISKDSSKPEPAQLIFETLENDDNNLLYYDLLKDLDGKNGWIVHRACSPNQLTFKYRRINGSLEQNKASNLVVNAQTLGLSNKIVFTKCLALTKIQDHQFAFLFQYKSSPKDRKKTFWGIGFAKMNEHRIHAIPLNRHGIGEQFLFLSPSMDKDTLSVYGYILDERNQWPYATITYRLNYTHQDHSPESVSIVNVFDQEIDRRLLNLKNSEGNMNKVDDSYASLQVHLDRSVTLIWRRRYKSSETMVQYSQGIPMYRELIRHHANDWIITHLREDGTSVWNQIIPMNLTTNDRTQQLDTYSIVVGQAMLLVGHQNINNRISPFILQILPNGHAINPDLENRLKGQSPKWDGFYPIDANNLIVPSRQSGRDGLLYLHFTKP